MFVNKNLWRVVVSLAVVGIIAIAAGSPATAKPPKAKKKAGGNPSVVMTIEVAATKKQEKITIELYAKDAPETVKHFQNLASENFYNGILFHRYVNGFVIQGGDPKSKKVKGSDIADITPEEVNSKFNLGDGGSGTTVPLEAKASHVRGTIGLARSQDPHSGDSQFFFNLNDNLRLDSGYCSFGKITKGIEIMDKLRQGDKIISVKPVKK